jgi:hypothetical protein
MLKDSAQLGDFLKSEAERRGAKIAFDTHFEARNIEVSWWRARTLHRLDFQPLGGGKLAVTYLQDRFPLLPRFFRWAHQRVPYFPYLARTEHKPVLSAEFPLQEQAVTEIIDGKTRA